MAHHAVKHSVSCCVICCCDGGSQHADSYGGDDGNDGSDGGSRNSLVNKDMLRMVAARAPPAIGIGLGEGGLTLYAFVVCFGRLPQGAQQCFEKSLGEWALLTRYDQCAGILGKDALAALSLMPKWPKLTEPVVRSQPVPTSTEMSPLVGGSDGGGINGDTVTQGDVQNALAQVPPSVRKVLPEGAASIYAFIVCYGRLPVKGDTLTVGSTQHEVYKWAQVLLKSQAREDKPLSAELRGAFEAIPMWPVFSSTGIVL